jgi:hypothetical protein
MKYPLAYDRLGPALVRLSARTVERCAAEDQIEEQFLARDADEIPAILHLAEIVKRNEEEDCEDEIRGCIRFIASLSRVDAFSSSNHLGADLRM